MLKELDKELLQRLSTEDGRIEEQYNVISVLDRLFRSYPNDGIRQERKSIMELVTQEFEYDPYTTMSLVITHMSQIETFHLGTDRNHISKFCTSLSQLQHVFFHADEVKAKKAVRYARDLEKLEKSRSSVLTKIAKKGLEKTKISPEEFRAKQAEVKDVLGSENALSGEEINKLAILSCGLERGMKMNPLHSPREIKKLARSSSSHSYERQI